MAVNESYSQGFMYAHGMSTLPTWIRSYNATTQDFVEWNFYDTGNLINATGVFTLPSVCNDAKPGVMHTHIQKALPKLFHH